MKTTRTSPEIEIIFEDNHLLVVNKPAGILSQEDHTGDPDILTLCKEYIKNEYNKPGNVFLGLLHRLDRPVSGVMMIAKTSKAASRISEQIRSRTIKKKYLAVVSGNPPPNGYLTHFLLKDEKTNTVKVVEPNVKHAQDAKLMFQRLETVDNLHLLKVSLITGRPHQIRVQLSEEGYPIWGDQKYGESNRSTPALHAYSLELEHPTLKTEMIFSAKPPNITPWNNFHSKIST
jgi:23S rRNA pseudouridine1911/1915/1917 synthase